MRCFAMCGFPFPGWFVVCYSAARSSRVSVIAARGILRLGVVGDGLVFRHLLARLGEADDLAGKRRERPGAGEFGPFHRQRQQGLQRRAVEVLEHEQAAAPVGEVEIADDAGDLDAVIGLAGRALVQLFEPRAHLRVLPLLLGREHDGAAAAEVDQFVDHGAEVAAGNRRGPS